MGYVTSTHLPERFFKAMAGVGLMHVPSRSTAPAAAALLDGQVQVMFDTLPSALPQVREGRLRALGVTAPQRLPGPSFASPIEPDERAGPEG